MMSPPEKLYFKIGEVAEMTGVKPHVLRYWESEFSCIRPVKSRKNQRLYQQKDIDLILQLKDLLYLHGFTIAGARSKLRETRTTSVPCEGSSGPGGDTSSLRAKLKELREDLLRVRDSISTNS